MSERPASTTTAPAPEKGIVNVAANLAAVMNEIDPTWAETKAAEEKQEREAAERERASLDRASLFTRASAIKDLPPTGQSFGALLNVIHLKGIAYDGKEDFGAIVGTFEGTDAGKELDDSVKPVLEYLKSEYRVAALSRAVDFDAFTKKTVAFPESPMAGKTEYIIEDIKNALKEEKDPKKQDDLKVQLQTMENYSVILSEGDERPRAGLMKEYGELINNKDADPKAVEEAQKLLDTLSKRNNIEAAAYRIISDYYPSDKSFQGIVTKVASEPLGEVVTQTPAAPATNEAISPQEKAQLELEKSKLETYRSDIAKTIAKRENSRVPYGLLDGDVKKGANPIRPKYDATAWRVFDRQNTMPQGSPERLQDLFKYVVKEAGALEREVNALRNSPRDIDTPTNPNRDEEEDSIMGDLMWAIREAREEMVGKKTDEEIYDYLQEVVHDSFEDIIKIQRSSGKVDNLKAKVQAGSERVRGAGRNVGDKLKESDRAKKVLNLGQGAVKFVVRGRRKDTTESTDATRISRRGSLRKNVVESFKEVWKQGRKRALGRTALGRRSNK